MTSPPFGLVRKKDYGNVEADQYVEWFEDFAVQFKHVLKDNGSLVICAAALGRFVRDPQETAKLITNPDDPSNFYWVPRPGILWSGDHGEPLPKDGGKKRRSKKKQTTSIKLKSHSWHGGHDANARKLAITKFSHNDHAHRNLGWALVLR